MCLTKLVIVKKNILTFCILTLFISCNEDISNLGFETKTIVNTFEANIEIVFDKATGNSDFAKQINNTIESELIKSIPNAEDYNNLDDALKAFDEQYKTFKTDFEEDMLPWELAMETEITYQSNKVITIAVSSYSDTGGAHGNDAIRLLNFNTTTGKLYTLSDMISDENAFKNLAENHFEKNLEFENRTISEFFFGEAFQLPENIGFSDEGLILLYNVYEIASYSEGYTEFVISFDDLGDNLKIN